MKTTTTIGAFAIICTGCGAEASPETGQLQQQLAQLEGNSALNHGAGIVSDEPTVPSVGAMTSEDRNRLSEAKSKLDSLEAPNRSQLTIEQRPSRTERALLAASSVASESVLLVTVEIEAPPMFDESVDRPTQTPIAELVEARKAELQDGQDRVRRSVENLGGRVVSSFWIGGSALVVEISAKNVPALVRIPTVREIGVPEPGGSPGASHDLGDGTSTLATRTYQLFAGGWESGSGNRVNTANPMRIGIIEPNNMIDSSHVGFKTSTGTNRIKNVMSCNTISCTSTSPQFGGSHGTTVTSIAAGSIAEGQDSNFPGTFTSAQWDRTGYGAAADVYYYKYDSTGEALRNALQRAVIDGVDVVNMSVQYEACDPTVDRGGANAALHDAYLSGVVLVAISGNYAGSMTDGCEIAWPGSRPDVLAVGGLLTNDTAVPYKNTTPGIGCAIGFGGMPITSHDGASSTATVMGLVAPGWVNRTYGAGPNTYNGDMCGSSFAAPAVAGMTADLRDHFRFMGWNSAANSAPAMMLNMMLMGDAYDGNAVVNGVSYRSLRPNNFTGYGRVRMRLLNSTATPWKWAWSSATIQQGGTLSINIDTTAAEPAGITQFKTVAMWVPDSLTDVADVDMELYDTCPVGGGAAWVAGDASRDYHSGIRIPGSQASGKCLQLRLYGYSVPPAGQRVYYGYMYHSSDI